MYAHTYTQVLGYSELVTHEATHFTGNSISTFELSHRSRISRYAHTYSTHACFSITMKTEDSHCIFVDLSVSYVCLCYTLGL